MESSIAEIRDKLEFALGKPDVWLIHNGSGGSGRDPEDDTENEAEMVARYWVYWNEFGQALPRKQRRKVLSWCLFRKQTSSAPEGIIENGLAHVTSEIHRLIMCCQNT